MPSAYSANAIAVSVALDSAKMLKGLKGINANLASVGKIGAAAFVGLAAGITKAGFAASDHVMRLELIQNKAKIVFGDQQSLIRSWSEETASSFGLTAINLEGMAAGFQDLLVPMGFARETAAGMTMDVVGLAGAMSEWSNGTRTVEDTTRILARAMLGEREMLKDLGVDIRELDIKQRLMSKGQEDLTGNMLKQARATATMELIFERSKDAQDGFAAGSDTLIRKTRIMQAGFEEVAQKILLALTPAFKAIVDTITSDFIPFLEETVEPKLEDLAEAFSEKLPEAIEFFKDNIKLVTIPVEMLADAIGVLHNMFVGLKVVLSNNYVQAGLIALAITAIVPAVAVLGGPVAALSAGFVGLAGAIGTAKIVFAAVVGPLGFLLNKIGKSEKATKNYGAESGRAAVEQEKLNKKLEKSTAKFHELARASDKELIPTMEDQREILEGLDQGYTTFDESFYNAQISANNFANSLKNLTAEQYATAVASEILASSAGQDMIEFNDMYDRAVRNLRMFLSPDEEGTLEALKRQLMKAAGIDSVDFISPGNRTSGSGGSGGSKEDDGTFLGYANYQLGEVLPDRIQKLAEAGEIMAKVNNKMLEEGQAHFRVDLDALYGQSGIEGGLGSIGFSARTNRPNEEGPHVIGEAIDEAFIRVAAQHGLKGHALESFAETMKEQAIQQKYTVDQLGNVLNSNLYGMQSGPPTVPDPEEDLENFLKNAERVEIHVKNEFHGDAVDILEPIAAKMVTETTFKKPGMPDAIFGAQP